jgi:hypothetical protein
VEDAINLAWKMASVVKGLAPLGLLATYETERQALALRNTAFARHFADSIGLFVATPELEADCVQGEMARKTASDYLNRHARLEFNIPGVTLGGRYHESPIILHDGAVLPPDEPNTYVPSASPGGRPPHAWMEDGRSLYDLFHAEWTLLALGPHSPSTQEMTEAAKAMGIDLRVVRLTAPALMELYEASLVLIRPDQIVAWRGDTQTGAASILSQLMGYGSAHK